MRELATQNQNLTVFNSDALNQAYEFAQKISQSGIIPRALQGKPADICVTLQTGVELGFSPMVALRSIDVIQGTPAIKPQAMLALIRSKLPKSKVKMDGDNKKAVCTIIRDKTDPDDSYTATWTIVRAQQMGLLNKDNWKKQPGNMLMWRAVGEAARFACPDIIGGMYNTSEVSDFENYDNYTPETKDIEGIVKDHKTQLSQPEAVESTAKKEEIEDAVYQEVGDNAEASEEAAIIHQIDNRDYIVPLGQYEGKKLFQIKIEDLRKYGKSLEEGFKKLAEKGKNATEAQSALIANVTAYVSKYDEIEISMIASAPGETEDPQLDIEIEAKKSYCKTRR